MNLTSQNSQNEFPGSPLSIEGCRLIKAASVHLLVRIEKREENLGCKMKNWLSIVETVAIASNAGMFHVFLLSFVKLTGPTLLFREVVLDYHDTQSQICLDRFQQLLRTILYWQGSRAPWKSLNLKIKIQGLESPWKLRSVLESPWLSVVTLSNSTTRKDLQDKIALVEELKKT